MEKTFKTLDEQINILIDKGLTINDIDKAKEAEKELLENIEIAEQFTNNIPLIYKIIK